MTNPCIQLLKDRLLGTAVAYRTLRCVWVCLWNIQIWLILIFSEVAKKMMPFLFCIVSLLRGTLIHINQTNFLWKKNTCIYEMYPSKIHTAWITVVWSMLLPASSYTQLSERLSRNSGNIRTWFCCEKAGSWCPPRRTQRLHQHICNTSSSKSIWTSHEYHLTTSAYNCNTNHIHRCM